MPALPFGAVKVLPSAALSAALLVCACGDNGPQLKEYPLDDVLRINHAQVKGTHNSYHIDPGFNILPWSYTHLPLDRQFNEQGVRQIELDIYWDITLKDFRVYHVPMIDEKSTCNRLSDCLNVIKRWSADNPQHLPIFVLVEPKDDAEPYPFAEPYVELEKAMLKVFGRSQVITPDDVQGSHSTLLQAVEQEGWPLLRQARGKVILALLAGEKMRKHYTHNETTLKGRLMFVTGAEGKPFGVVASYNDPRTSGDKIKAAVNKGLLVRTRADSEGAEPAKGDYSKLEAALKSGGHYISTDYPAKVAKYDYVVQIPGGTPARCNPENAPPQCTSRALEDNTP